MSFLSKVERLVGLEKKRHHKKHSKKRKSTRRRRTKSGRFAKR
ncbi:MAG TPA: hypothetical protein VMU24_02285 [Candidatus Acidoferrales bacterium]|nr:hypothetical protein [Candidatus Acidoferrales bacterium]